MKCKRCNDFGYTTYPLNVSDNAIIKCPDCSQSPFPDVVVKESDFSEDCYLCKKPINNIHGNPNLWGIKLPYKNGNGKQRNYHVGCVADIIDKSDVVGDNGLKPCPFCGNKDISVVMGTSYFWVECLRCDINGPARKEKVDAIKAWNKRV